MKGALCATAVGILILTACSSDGGSDEAIIQSTTQPAPTSTLSDSEEALEEVESEYDESLARVVAAAVDDLSTQLGIDSDAIVVLAAEAVQWPDAGIGCPDADSFYAQVITPGYRVELEARNELYLYHADDTGVPLQCSKPRPPIDVPGGGKFIPPTTTP